jgi:uncharacterized membrane protein
MRGIRQAFLTGLFLCLPLVVTVYVVQFLVELAAKPVKSLVLAMVKRMMGLDAEVETNFWFSQSVVLVSAITVVVGITVIGLFSRYLLGRLAIRTLERIIQGVPMIKSVYTATKQIVSTFGAKKKANFKQVVLVPFPHAGAWTVAFVTNRDPSELSEALGYPVVHVFVPTTPNPTGGYFLLLREADVKPLKMSVAEGMKLIVSGGAVLPEGGKLAGSDDALPQEGAHG